MKRSTPIDMPSNVRTEIAAMIAKPHSIGNSFKWAVQPARGTRVVSMTAMIRIGAHAHIVLPFASIPIW